MPFVKTYKILKIVGYISVGLLMIAGLTCFILAFVIDNDQSNPNVIAMMICSPLFTIFGLSSLLFTIQTRLKRLNYKEHEILVYAGNVTRALVLDGDVVDIVKTFDSVKSSNKGNIFKASNLQLSARTKEIDVLVSIGTFNSIDIDVKVH